jgi:penicillin-binding protein 1B
VPLKRMFVLGALVCAGAAAIYVIYLDRMVTHQFEGRRWTLPAQVFAAPLRRTFALGERDRT